jgi:hypothetical protein
MFTTLMVRFYRWMPVLLISVIGLTMSLTARPVTAQGQLRRLGELRVDMYCLQRGYSAWIINNGNDWACTTSNGAIAIPSVPPN